ncbi:MAG: hypothetical protein SGJ02_00415, partial [bacterium]|nr:hypothetical protein [bacterium]
MNQLGEGTNTIGAISDYFVVETKILSTRTADLYISQDKTRGGDVSLWQLRAPLEVGSSMIAEYIKRMEIIEAINPPVSDFVGFAVDNKGTAFAVLARLDGNTLTEGTPEFSELERRFVSCVELISRIHNASIICGDICKNSFWLNRAGSVRFIGVMGAYELDRENGIKLYPESQYYLAPEQISDCNIDLSVDVYALGVLGYFLFTGKFPEKTPIQPSQVLKGVPFWADEVLLKALSENPAQRYQSAVELLADIKGKRELYAQDPNKVRHQIRNSGVEDSPSTGISSISLGTQLPIKKVKFSKGTILKISLVVMLISVALVGLWPFYSQFSHAKKLSSSLSAHRAIAGEQLNTAIDGLLSGNLASPGKKKFLNQIVNSDDPVAHAVLVTLSRNSAYPEIRKECENAIVERARSAGISRSADIASVWLSSFSGNINPPAYVEEVLLVLNGTLPSDARAKAIRRIYAENPPLALNLAASFSLDSSNDEDYRSVLAQLLGDKLKINDL